MKKRDSDWPVFLGEVITNWRSIGAVAPSSRRLARDVASMIPYAQSGDAPRRILEIGAGTGRFTDEIVRRMGPDDSLVIYEPTDAFASYLVKSIEHDPIWSQRHIELRRMLFPEKVDGEKYDYAVCGLPLNNLDPEIVDQVLTAFSTCLDKGGSMAYFEYCQARNILMKISTPDERRRFREIDSVMDGYVDRFRVKKTTTFLNIPPAWVHTLKFPEEMTA